MDAIADHRGKQTTAARVEPFWNPDSLCARLAANGADDAVVSSLREELDKGESSPLRVILRFFEEGLLAEPEFLTCAADVLDTEVLSDIPADDVDPGFVDRVPIAYVRRHRVLGLMAEDGCITFVTDRPRDLSIVDYLSALLRTPAVLRLAPSAVLTKAINVAYTERESDFDTVFGEMDEPSTDVMEVAFAEDGDLLDSASRAPVIKLVNMFLFEAVKRMASDVHVQPVASHVQIRFRIDGVLYDYLDIPSQLSDEVISRIKVIGKMDIAEKRIAQDGRTTVTVGDRVVDLRISIIPTSFGERAVLRLLDKSARLYELPQLGMSGDDRTSFEQLIENTHGIILVTGPTGSGKSTTLYAALQHLDCKERNILTLEDPIEYQLPGISQMQVATKKGMTFATGLRAVLRQDPDIIMVGEIRDEETARMAVQSSLTGHLVFSTLHTNNAAGAVARLLDLGIEPYLVASSLLACVAQRLVRVVCQACNETVSMCSRDVERLGQDASLENTPIRRAVGCEECSQTGYRGRKGVFEILTIDEEIRELIVGKPKASAIESQAISNGMSTLRQDAIRMVIRGETTLEEVERVTQKDAAIVADAS
jgi:general secretion pathway protein E